DPLPISLLDFSAIANNNKVDLKWETATETNNAYFTIEKSKDGVVFTKLIDILGAGNSTSQKNYYESDYQPYNGTSYYRLKQTDFNGNYKYFTVVVVDFNAKKNISFYPTPVKTNQSLNVQIDGYKNEEVLVVLRDIQGREFYSKVLVTHEETQLFAIDVTQQILPGIYLIVASSNGNIYSQKIIVRE
ncbi:MAG: T9SS type A sorting domain-containing protein, partial [Bacteroidia bacterium]